MKRLWWILRAFYWLNYYTSWHWFNLDFADGLYDRADLKLSPRQAVEEDVRKWYE